MNDEVLFELFDLVNTPIFMHRAGKIIYANQALRDLSGFSGAELLDQDFYRTGYGEWAAVLKDRGERRLRGEVLPNVYEFRLNTKSGQECWVELMASRLNLQGSPTVFCSLHDLTDRKRAEVAHKTARQFLAQVVDSDPVATFVIDTQHRVTHWNNACALFSKTPAAQLLGTTGHRRVFFGRERDTLADLVLDARRTDEILAHYPNDEIRLVKRGDQTVIEGEGFLAGFGDAADGAWVIFTAVLLRDGDGKVVGAVEKLQDITRHRRAEDELRQYHTQLEHLVHERTSQLDQANQRLAADLSELTELNARLTQTQQQLHQSEKMASIGQLAAGVAHEINNPIGYVFSNISTLDNYLKDLLSLLALYEKAGGVDAEEIHRERQRIDVDFLKEDIPLLMQESKEGIGRVNKIVQDLKDFSRVDSSPEFQWADLHQGIDSTLNVVNNEIKYKADVIREYGKLPEVECLPSQLNQVFLNLLVNAAHAMGEKRGVITIRSGVQGDQVWLEFADNGCGMSEDVQKKIFDPFFTTKPIGKGTGLGLSLSYGIIQKHRGTLAVASGLGVGTTFRIELPIRHPSEEDRA